MRGRPPPNRSEKTFHNNFSPERVAGCPSDAERLSSGVCLAFLPSCPNGCSRCCLENIVCICPGGVQWRSVSSLEVSLLTPLDFVSSLSFSSSQQSKFNDRMLALTVAINHHHNNLCRKYNTSSWWTGGTDFKKESGRFSWERQDLTLSDAEELWVNGTFGPSSTTEGETGHQCVFIDHYQGVAITTFTLFQFWRNS